MYLNSSPKVVRTAFAASILLLVAFTMVASKKIRGKKWTKMSTNDFSFGTTFVQRLVHCTSSLASTSKPMSRTRAISSALFWAWKTKSTMSSPRSSIAGGGGRFGCRRFPPNLAGSLLFHPNPSLRSVEEAGDSAAPKNNGDEPLPSTGRHITANGDEIINAPARLGVDKSRGNVLRRPDEFYEARAAGSLAETKCCRRCHRRR